MPWRSLSTVHVLSSHPLVLEDLKRLLTRKGLLVEPVRLEHGVAPTPGGLAPEAGSACIVDACFPPVATASLVAEVASRWSPSRVLILAEELGDGLTFPLLHLGIKGFVAYADVRTQLLSALGALARGGCWVPRSVLSRFLDDLMRSEAPRTSPGPFALSHREQDVLDSLLLNLSNKEIGARLHISERTVKFHVSNLLGKFSVPRRADLILRTLQHTSLPWPRVQPSPLDQVQTLDQ